MSILPPIYALLSNAAAVAAIVDDRIYPHAAAPQDVTRPYITWYMIGTDVQNTLSELPQIDGVGVHIDCWHQSPNGATTLAKEVRDAIEPVAHMTGIPVNERERDTKLYRIGLQFDYWLER